MYARDIPNRTRVIVEEYLPLAGPLDIVNRAIQVGGQRTVTGAIRRHYVQDSIAIRNHAVVVIDVGDLPAIG
jgi:hypothetical protein